MKPGSNRQIRVAIARVSYDIVLTSTTDTGGAKLAGEGELVAPATGNAAGELGQVDLTFWGSTTAQLKMRAKSWPARFDRVTAGRSVLHRHIEVPFRRCGGSGRQSRWRRPS